MSFVGNWNYPTTVRFGAGRVRETAQNVRDLGSVRPLVVTDPGVAKLPWFEDLLGDLRAAGLDVGVFSDVHPNPTGSDVDAGLAVLRAEDRDGVVALGGIAVAVANLQVRRELRGQEELSQRECQPPALCRQRLPLRRLAQPLAA